MADGDIRFSGASYNVVEDWSLVRSPSRAARRLKRGYRQNLWYFETEKDGTRKWPLAPIHDRSRASKRRSA